MTYVKSIKIILIAGLVVGALAWFFTVKTKPKTTVTICYNQVIDVLSSNDVQCLRASTIPNQDAAERQVLLEKVLKPCSIDTVMTDLNKKYNATDVDVVIWLADFTGQVYTKTMDWYGQQVFAKLPQRSIVWGANFDKWNVIASKVGSLAKSNPELIKKMAGIKADDTTTWLTLSQCPFTQNQMGVVTDVAGSRFKALQAGEFFIWLTTLLGSVKNLSGNVYKKLCRKRPETISQDLNNPDARVGCSLRQLGLSAPFLDVAVNGKSLLDTDVYCIAPLLEYLEALYYITILARSNNKPESTIIFLVHMRDLMIFLVPEEKERFATFRLNVNELVPDASITIDIQPFVYNASLVAAPFKIGGNVCNNQDFIQMMKTMLPK